MAYKDLTKEQDLIDLGWHQKEFQMRKSFAYKVVDKTESLYFGCVYIFPSAKKQFDAEVYLWVDKKEFNNGFDKELFDFVKVWLEKEWPFKKVAFPGREIGWEEWKLIN